jgi:hypothetical protein
MSYDKRQAEYMGVRYDMANSRLDNPVKVSSVLVGMAQALDQQKPDGDQRALLGFRLGMAFLH